MRKKHRRIAFLFLGLFCMMFVFSQPFQTSAEELAIYTQEERDYIDNCGEIEIGCFSNCVPISFLDESGEMIGIFPDLVRLIGEKSGLKIKVTPLSDKSSPIQEVLNQNVDMAAGIVASNEVTDNPELKYTGTLYEETIVVITQAGREYKSFEGCTIALPETFVYAETYLDENYENYRIIKKASTEECLDAVVKGEADMTMRDSYMANYILQKPYYNKLVVEDTLIIPEPVCIIANANVDDMRMKIISKTIQYIKDWEKNQITVRSTVSLSYHYSMLDMLYLYRYGIIAVCLGAAIIILAVVSSVHHRTEALLNEKEKEVFRLKAEHDPLTGIYNRENFNRKVHDMLLENPDKEYDIITLNIEHFKIINDLFGMEEGDRLLTFIAKEIGKKADEQTLYGRLMGDHFAVCMPRTAQDTGQMYRQALAEYPLDLRIAINIGIYHIEKHDMPVNLMCDRAFLAIESIKGSFRNQVAVYNESHREKLIQEQEVLNDTRQAFENHEFQVYIQPKNCIESGAIVGGEALIRWQHPQKGLLPPNVFIPIFERNGLVDKLDFYVLEETCAILKRWKEEGRELIPISVNLSRIDFYSPNICQRVLEVVNQYELDPQYIEFEVTETAYASETQFIYGVLRDLQKNGFKILMDDFGSGYSSLNMLKEAPIDILKLDMGFLSDSMQNEKSRKIVEAVIKLSIEICLPVIAEGVENESQLMFLSDLHCTWAQGYYFAKPLPVAEFERMLSENV